MTPQFELDGFEILEKLGEGGMAAVWKARQLSLDRLVAIKTLSGLTHDADDIQRFEDEARAAAKLKHQGIVQVYDANAREDRYYIVMEYVSGYTVGAWVRKKGCLKEEDALLVAECVADALCYAWERERIIHCDIKPDNVMIDGDGTVKVADLGLARTIRAISVDEAPDEIMGTPAYISPEQACGSPDLDCRADIYSLGAMLYHLLTGCLMFQGQPEEIVLENQVNGYVDDAMDVNEALSGPVCWLLELMLAKDPAYRPRDWEQVKDDLKRVRHGKMPHGFDRLPEGESTMLRSPDRAAMPVSASGVAAEARRIQREARRSPVVGVALAVALVGLAAIAGIAAWIRNSAPPPVQPAPKPVPAVPAQDNPRAPGEDQADRRARLALEQAAQWAKDHPYDYDEAERRLRGVARDAAGTGYAAKASRAADIMAQRREAEAARIKEELSAQVQPLVDRGEFFRAARVLANYSGRGAKLCAEWRASEVRKLREQATHAAHADARRAGEQLAAFNAAFAGVADSILAGQLAAAEQAFREAVTAAEGNTGGVACDLVLEHLSAAAGMEQRILDSFRSQIGSQVSVVLNSGAKQLKIDAVAGGKVTARSQLPGRYVFSTIEFGVADLSQRERLTRMGGDNEPGVALAKGVMAMQSKAFEHAKRYFLQTPEDLWKLLVPGVSRMADSLVENAATGALRLLLTSFGAAVGASYDHDTWLASAAALRLSSNVRPRIAEAVAGFRRNHGGTEAGQAAEDILQALEAACGPDTAAASGSPVLGSGTALLPPALAAIRDDPDAVASQLRSDNPRAEAHAIEVGTIYDRRWSGLGARITSPDVNDIDALAALSGLQSFTYEPPRDTEGALKDLHALKGLPLERVSIVRSKVYDLRDLPVAVLQIAEFSQSSVRSLDPLRGAPLSELDISHTRVTDLSPIASAALERLVLDGCGVRNLRDLSEMPLDDLSLEDTGVSDFSPLSDLTSLRSLNLAGTAFRDLQLITARRLRRLNLANTSVRDISRIAHSRLTWLNLSDTGVKDFSPLQDTPLEWLNLNRTAIRDLSVLNGMPLSHLELDDTAVADISVLQGMPLESLSLRKSRVASLGPLLDSRITFLDVFGIPARDFHVLRRLPLTSLNIENPERYASLIEELSSLEKLNGVDLRYDRTSPFYRPR